MVVDPCRPALQPVGHRLGPVEIGAPDRAAQPEAGVVGRLDGLVQAPVRQHRQDRAELFLRHHRALGGDIGQDRGGEEVAGAVQPVAAGHGSGADGQGLGRVALDPRQLGAVVDRPQLGARIEPGPDGDALRPLREGLDHLRVEPGRGVDALDRHADLPAVAERRPEQPVRDPLHRHVLQQDRGIVAAQLQGDPGERGRRALGDGPTGGNRTGEGHVADPRVGGEAGAERFATGDDRQDALGEGGGEHGPQQPGGEGVNGEGLSTIVLPAASAGANFADASWRGSSTGRSRRRAPTTASGPRCAPAGRP